MPLLGSSSSLPFAYNLEHATVDALRLLVHCPWAPVEAELQRCLRLVEEMTHSTNEQDVDAMLSGLVSALAVSDDSAGSGVPQEDPWRRRWLAVLRHDDKKARANPCAPTPCSSPQRAPSVQFGSPRAHSSIASEEEVCAARATLCVVVVLRHLALRHLRALEVLHLQIQYCATYWKWGLDHPVRCYWHLLMSGKRQPWSALLLGARSALHNTTREVVSRVSELQSMELYVVRCIGRVYNALESMRSSIVTVAYGDPDSADVLEVLQGALTRAIHAMARRSYRSGGSVERGYAHGSQGSLYIGSSSIPHVESVIVGDELDEEAKAPLLQRHVSRIADVSREQSSWIRSWRDALTVHMAPPPGRHWGTVATTLCILAPLCRAVMTVTVADMQRFTGRLYGAAEYAMQWYVVGPATNLYESLYVSREGVEERRAKLRSDVESMAKLIKDYHEDYYDEGSISHGELEHIRQNAIEGDYGLISRHLGQAIRHPIRGFFFGNLVRLTLIEVQHLKLDVARVLGSFDEVLEANDINFRMMALGPLLLLSLAVVSYGVFRKKKKRRPALAKMRLLWRSLHRLITFAETDDADDEGRVPGRPAPSSTNSFLDEEQQGRVVLTVHHLRLLREFLTNYPLTEAFLEDLDDLEAPTSTRHQRLRTLDRMMAVHFFLAAREE